jgi:hypothetical protein
MTPAEIIRVDWRGRRRARISATVGMAVGLTIGLSAWMCCKLDQRSELADSRGFPRKRPVPIASADGGTDGDDAKKRKPPTPTWWDVQVDPDEVTNTYCADPSNGLSRSCQEIQRRKGQNPALQPGGVSEIEP